MTEEQKVKNRLKVAEWRAKKKNDPEYKRKQSERGAKLRAKRKNDPVYVAKQREYRAKCRAAKRDDSEYAKKRREYDAKRRNDPERKRKIRELNAKYYVARRQDPELLEKERKQQAEYRASPKGIAKRKISQQKETMKHRTVPADRLRDYKKAAADRKLEFAINDDTAMALFENICHYCGSKKDGELNGIDRYDNERHYPESNCVPACTRCNFMKRNMAPTAFLDQVMAIAVRQLKDGFMERLQNTQ